MRKAVIQQSKDYYYNPIAFVIKRIQQLMSIVKNPANQENHTDGYNIQQFNRSLDRTSLCLAICRFRLWNLFIHLKLTLSKNCFLHSNPIFII